ncbi:UEV-domain-containing protein [Mycena pura]|uniref:UEV-domain-containing protein n=1 Tax=Mycena pura TaxID=153505 RepID=A0AAD6YGQ6_9AGAR|nr:UEV-domain-containing protein [Mycena pura]
MSLTQKWLRENIAPYPAPDRVYADIDTTLARYPSLRPKSDIYTYDDGRTQLLLCVHGLLPITYRGASYNIPVALWIPRDYPREPPLPYVVPTTDMLVKPGPRLDVSGRSSIDYVQQWARKSEGCSLVPLLEAMQAEFSQVPPVYAKPKESRDPPRQSQLSPQQSQLSPQQSQLSPQQPPQQPLQQHQEPARPQPPQPPVLPPKPQTPQQTLSPILAVHHPPPVPPHVRPDSGPPHYRAPPHYQVWPQFPPQPPPPPVNPQWPATPPPPAIQHYTPPPPLPPPIATPFQAPPPIASPPQPPPPHVQVPSLLDEDDQQAPAVHAVPTRAHLPPRPPNPELLRLHAAVHAKLSAEAASLEHALALDAERLRAHQADLLAGEPALRDEMARLEAVRDVCRTAAGRMRNTVETAERNVAELRAKSEPEVDELVCSTTIVHNQLINLVAEDNAIEDTIFHLSKALNSGRIDLERFLRSCRLLAEEQFMKRALIDKIETGLAGSTY